MEVGAALQWSEAELRSAGIGPARLEAEVLLACSLGVGRAGLLARLKDDLTPRAWEAYSRAIARRMERYPLQYLTGHQEFMSLDFLVNPAVLIPRTDTEVLVEGVLRSAMAHPLKNLVDVGTGCGVVAISLAHYLTDCRVWATELSPSALSVARSNVRRLGVADRVRLIHGDLLRPFLTFKEGRYSSVITFDAVVGNLPYLSADEMANLSGELVWEPAVALSSGTDGTDLYRRIFPQAFEVLRPGGLLALEVGDRIAQTVAGLAELAGFTWIEIRQDTAGRDRVLVARRGLIYPDSRSVPLRRN